MFLTLRAALAVSNGEAERAILIDGAGYPSGIVANMLPKVFAAVADDHAMQITEIVRGADLLKSTARQLLLYRALRWEPPEFYHCDLVRDEAGARLAKRHDSLSIRTLRQNGWTADQVRERVIGNS